MARFPLSRTEAGAGIAAGYRGRPGEAQLQDSPFTKWDAPHNVIQGQFLEPGQRDWAVLCRHQDRSSILLYPGNVIADVQTVRSENHDPYRIIHTVTKFVLQKRAIRDKLTESVPEFDHDAIEDGPIQKAAIVLYHRDGEWTEF